VGENNVAVRRGEEKEGGRARKRQWKRKGGEGGQRAWWEG
jgi:ribosome assembly protein YihI (activator of Der GTPase)